MTREEKSTERLRQKRGVGIATNAPSQWLQQPKGGHLVVRMKWDRRRVEVGVERRRRMERREELGGERKRRWRQPLEFE